MKENDGSDYEIAWWKYLNKNPQMKRFFIVWDSLSLKRRRDVIVLARALVQEDSQKKLDAAKLKWVRDKIDDKESTALRRGK